MRLILVYNADAGVLAGIIDSIHKTISPSTYSCSLCAVTYGALTMSRHWRDYLRSLPFETTFYHRPDFRAAFPHYAELPLPLIALERERALEVLLDTKALQRVESVDALIAQLEAKLPKS